MNNTERNVLAIDIGTTAVKIGLFSTKGELIEIASREQELIFPQIGFAEQSPEATWKLIADAVKEIMSLHKECEIAAVAVSVQRGTVIPIDADGNPLSNLIVWMDQRGLPYVDRVNKKVGSGRYRSIAGSGISYISGESKTLWIQNESESVWQKTRVIGTPQTYFLRRLGSEEFVCDYSSASSHFPMDIEHKVWSQELATQMGYPLERLPKLVSAVDVVGYLSENAAEELGLKAGIPLVAGGGDGQCAGVGSGVLHPGLCMINIGTATGVQVYLPQPRLGPEQKFSCSGHVDPDAWEMEGHTQASGVVLKWFRDEFGQAELACERYSDLNAFDLLVDQALKARPGADGLLLLPTFNGCTAPVSDPNMKGSLIGLRLSHTRSHIIRAMLEGITLEIRWMLEEIEKSGIQIDEVRLVGGGSRNQVWNQIHADILGRPVKIIQIADAALVGCGMCAAVGIGAFQSLQEAAGKFVNIQGTVKPKPENLQIYQKAFQNYLKAFSLFSEKKLFL